MADKPLYYGGKKSGPIYYGGNRPSYGGRNPMYYGGAGRAYSGAYGQYGGSNGMEGGDDGSIVGKVTLSRMCRVVSQRWLSVFVFLLIGLIVSFAVYRVSPTIYEASSEFTMDTKRSLSRGDGALDDVTPDYGNTYAEIFNTRISSWRSEKIVSKIIELYRAEHKNSTVSDDELMTTLAKSEIELQRNSRIITVSVRSQNPELCAALANAYVLAIEAHTDEENKIRCEKAVSQIKNNVETKRAEVTKVAEKMSQFRTANKVDTLRSERDTTQQAIIKTTNDILTQETEESQLVEWEKMLAEIQKNPLSHGILSTGVPRAQEIATEHRAFLDAESEYNTVLADKTEQHPVVISKKQVMESAKQRFLDAVKRAHQTGISTLQVTRNQLQKLRVKLDDLRNQLSSFEQRIVLAESGLGQYEAEFGVANRVLEGLILEYDKARIEAEKDNERITIPRKANVPTTPVLPQPLLIFGVGIFLSLILGFVFVLVLDNLEDTVVNLSDIEVRLSLKVLAVLPHVRRKRREQVARFTMDERYSQFSEAVAGLRNLLDSPRYEAMNQCLLVISTQPGEGKTVTSSSLAITYAQAGKKTLHVDFDMRRPRLATVWSLNLDESRSFSRMMQKRINGEAADFSALVNRTDVDNLDIIASLPPENVSPSMILGSSAVAEFFEWARANYDRVIVDSPPYGLVGDVVSLAVVVDSVIIMCCPDRTHFKPIQYCSRSLTEAGANILGVVVNDVEISNASAFSPSTHHNRYGGKYGYGYGYGYGYKPKKKEAPEEDGSEPAEPAGDETGRDYADDE